jgi:hypothetical protein
MGQSQKTNGEESKQQRNKNKNKERTNRAKKAHHVRNIPTSQSWKSVFIFSAPPKWNEIPPF